MYTKTIVCLILLSTCEMIMCQRSPYAGSRPQGYKDRFRPQPEETNQTDDVITRFGENTVDSPSATQRPPIQGVEVVYGEPVLFPIPPPSDGSVALSSPTAIQTFQQFPNTAQTIQNTQQPQFQQQPQFPQLQQQPQFPQFPQFQQQIPLTRPINQSSNASPLENRFGGANATTNPLITGAQGTATGTQQQVPQSTPRLPYDARGDEDLVNRLNRLPVDQRPFWLVNYQAIEAHRNSTGNNVGTFAARSSFAGK